MVASVEKLVLNLMIGLVVVLVGSRLRKRLARSAKGSAPPATRDVGEQAEYEQATDAAERER